MGNYLGVKCPVCSGRFAGADDIVVCPVCGAPHHRHCYAQSGECVFVQDHISGKEWSPPPCEHADGFDGSAGQEGAKNCGQCGSANPPQTLFCQICGQPMTGAGSYAGAGQGGRPIGHPGFFPQYTSHFHQAENSFAEDAAAGQPPISGLPAQDVAMHIGPNSHHYLPLFYKIEEQSNAPQFNVAACFLNFFYYFYRKMYLVGTVMLAAFLLCLVPFFLFSWELLPFMLYQRGLAGPPAVAINMPGAELYSMIFVSALVVHFIVSFTLSMFANRIYHKQVVDKIRTLMQEYPDESQYRTALVRAGGVDRLSVVLTGISIFVGSNIIISVMINFL